MRTALLVVGVICLVVAGVAALVGLAGVVGPYRATGSGTSFYVFVASFGLFCSGLLWLFLAEVHRLLSSMAASSAEVAESVRMDE